ncbi:MAG: DNA repair protein RadC [Muribaculaceae bacterium]|nr:DNA repair protein RadC [Muribaculaceae bacterium]MBR5745017.1 DNA repair protein RadC [Muribaculaceae bacterium]
MAEDYSSRQESSSGFMIADLDSDDRPREKAIKLGIGSLTNAELLALLFGSGYRGMSVISLSQHILQENDNRLANIARKSIKELTAIKGIGPAKAITLAAAIELGCRCRDEQWVEDPVIKSPLDAYGIMRRLLENLNHEEMWAIFLSQSNRVIAKQRLSSGGITKTIVDPRVLFKAALENNATGMVLVHNHPSGNMMPSNDDDDLTRRVAEGAKVLNIRFIDHIIVAANRGYYSYIESGKLSQ